MNFEFATASRIIFGAGTVCQAGVLAWEVGRIPLIVTGRSAARAEPVKMALREKGLDGPVFLVNGEPTTDTVARAVEAARESHCDVVIGIGGGSVLDTAKAAAAMLTNQGDILDYLEIAGRGRSLAQPALPVIAVPTTAGTGSEVTRNAVLTSSELRIKVSLRSPYLLPRIALIDPELMMTMSPEVTATTGLDALSQLIEPFVSNKANAMADAFCREGMRRISRALSRAYTHGDDEEARESMALASLLGGLALAAAGLGAVHGFAGPIGGLFPAPHGAVCARLLPAVMGVNIQALKDRDIGSGALARYEEAARILTGEARATTRDGIEWVERTVAALGIPPLSKSGLTSSDFPVIIERAAAASSMKGNPIQLSPPEMREILTRAL